MYGVVTGAVLHPLIAVGGSAVSRPPDDPLFTTWIHWWNTQQWPLTDAWWNAPFFYPTSGVMAFSETLLGLLPITAPVLWLSDNPLLANNLALLLSFPLCAAAAYALAFELTGRHDAAWLAGLAFGFSPYRANEIGHVQMLSYYWAPIVLLALHRYLRTNRSIWLAVFAGAWLLQVLCNGYALFHLGILVALWLLWFSTTRRDRLVLLAVWVGATLPLVPILWKYREVQTRLHLTRSISDITRFSADIGGFLSSPPEVVLWGHRLIATSSQGLFPGLTILVVIGVALILRIRRHGLERMNVGVDRAILAAASLVCAAFAGSFLLFGQWEAGPLKVDNAFKPFSLALVAGLLCGARGSSWRRVWLGRAPIGFYAVVTVTMYVLSFGPEPRFWGRQVLYKPPYAWLMALPGFESIRVPARFAMLAVLCLAVVVALLYARWSSVAGRWRPVIWVALSIGLIADGWIRLDLVAAPDAGPSQSWAGAAAVLELPLEPERDAPALYRAIGSNLPLINGTSGYYPAHYPALTYALRIGDLDVIKELFGIGPIGIAVDRSVPGHERFEDGLSRVDGVMPLPASTTWARFLGNGQAAVRPDVGRPLPVRAARTNRHEDEIWRVLDARIDSVWSSDGPQDGHEELIVELDASHLVAGLTLHLGSRCAFGFPRDLVIEVSDAGDRWTGVWRGRTAIATVRAALDDPVDVPVWIQIDAVQARFPRLLQVGQDVSPWCIGELSVHQPVMR